MAEESYQQRKFYDRLIEHISQGDVELETEARELAYKFGFPERDLESALEDGRKNPYIGRIAYARLCLHICGGNLELEKVARRLAKKYRFDYTTDINLALHVGKSSSEGNR
jgi:hypothetical protein